MKKHVIIPIFIPHQGCPNDCVFCNQKKITARQRPVTEKEIHQIVKTWLSTLKSPRPETIEIAFYGGSFTGISLEQQSAYLAVAKQYKDAGLIDKIHLSTRPDYINQSILDNLRRFDADTIELGVQSFDDKVLCRSGRGHNSKDVYIACELIKDYGFELGIQLMIGLPEDSRQTCLFSARETVKLAPSIARLYPTVILKDTALYEMYLRKEYAPLPLEEAVFRTKEMYRILTKAGINIIRVGLKSSELIADGAESSGGTFHPAFRQLVEGEIAREELESLLDKLPCDTVKTPTRVEFCANSRNFSAMIGHHRRNKEFFLEKYPALNISYKINNDLKDQEYQIIIKGEQQS